jgi:hypothetical protein
MKDHTDILNDYETSLERQLVVLLHKEENINTSIQDLSEQLNAKHRSLETNEKQQTATKEKLAAVRHLKTEFHFNKQRTSGYALTTEQVKPLTDLQIKTLTTKDLLSLCTKPLNTLNSHAPYSNPWSADLGEPYSALSDMLFRS